MSSPTAFFLFARPQEGLESAIGVWVLLGARAVCVCGGALSNLLLESLGDGLMEVKKRGLRLALILESE